ncbi:MAG: hypothetical protein A2085_07945 [Gemmatimonadetes bacterium GWC2_71_10]|nr:MAG: hypothetical protein A2085_07945 [Gemmatimonadetes bacterium GWC2_71_10]
MDLDAALALNHARVDEFIAATARLGTTWTPPVRPGKWSPAEVAEHIAMSYRQTTELIGGKGGGGFPKVPGLLRPLVRRLGFAPVLKTGRFGRPVKTFKSLTPTDVPGTPDEAARRIRDALAAFEATVREQDGAAIQHPSFGTVRAADYIAFQAYHTTHHQAQLTAGPRP